MSDALFEFGDSSAAEVSQSPPPARGEQVTTIRAGLDIIGIVDQKDRQAFVESVVLAPTASLRDLSALQARRVIDRLKDAQTSKSLSTGSLWDDRDEETWIDRL